MPQKWRTLYLGQGTAMTDGKAWTALPLPADLPELLARVAHVATPPGVTIILGEGVHVDLGLPERLPRRDTTAHPVLESVRAVGWRCSQIDPWMTFWRPGSPTVHVGVRAWLRGGSDGNFQLADRDPVIEQLRLYRFHKMVGVPYHGSNSGLAGIDLLREEQKGRTPVWMPDNWIEVEPSATTVETVTEGWRTELPAHGLPFEHSYDARLQFLGAALNAKVAVGKLRYAPGGAIPVDAPGAVLPGYYEVTVPSWAYRDRIPHPLGDRRQYGDKVWITSATMELAVELAERDQVMAVPEVHQAWVAVGGQMLKPWAQKIRDAEHLARLSKDPVLHTVVKGVYKAGLGLMRRTESGRICRPDWQQTVVGLARSNLWRKMWREGRTSGRWPVEIHADAVWYAGADHTPDWPDTFREGLGPGFFQHEETRAVIA